jgi:hypothetical protein
MRRTLVRCLFVSFLVFGLNAGALRLEAGEPPLAGSAQEPLAGTAHDALAEALGRAASCSPEALRLLAALDEPPTLEELRRSGDVPLTLAVAVLATSAQRFAPDLVLAGRAGPGALADALLPTHTVRGERVPLHDRASLLHPEYITAIHLTSGTPGHGPVEGFADFRAPGVYEGRVAFSARAEGAPPWRVDRMAFPAGSLEVRRSEQGWSLHVAEARAPQVEAAPLDLPEVTQAGRRPERAVVVRLDRTGTLTVVGHAEPLGLDGLMAALQPLAAERKAADGTSEVDLLLEIDREVPWAATTWLMHAAAHPSVRMHRVWLGVTTPDSGAPAALAAFLPVDGDLAPLRFEARPGPLPKRKVKVLRSRTDEPSSVEALHAELRARPQEEREGTYIELVTPPPHGSRVATGYVVRVLDAVLRSGAAAVLFQGAATPPGGRDAAGLATAIQDMQGAAIVPMVKLDDDEPIGPALPAGAEPMSCPGTTTEYVGSDLGRLGLHTPLRDLLEAPYEEEAASLTGPTHRPRAGGALRIRGAAEDAPGAGGGMAAAAERAADEALRWLAAHQSPNGGWEAAGFANWCDLQPAGPGSEVDGAGKRIHDVGVTGLALQAFLAAGYTNRGDHEFAKTVSRGLRYLKNVQDPEGCFGPRSTQQYVYNHALAAQAMVEAYGMTGSPIFKGSAQRALDFIEQARNPNFAWRYGIQPGDNDTSVTACMVQVLAAASWINADAEAGGKPAPLRVEPAAFDGARNWIQKVTDPETGRVGYIARGAGSARPQELVDRFPADLTEAMTAAGCWIRWLLGDDPAKDPVFQRGLELVRALPPTAEVPGAIDHVYWTWGALVAWQAGGATWSAWETALHHAVTRRQRTEGGYCGLRGSWDPVGVWGAEGGRVAATASGALMCTMRRRYPRPLLGARAPR